MDCSRPEVAVTWHGREHASSVDTPLRSLPLVTLYLTERCNSRCVSCDYWRHGRRDMDLDAVQQLLPEMAALGTRVVLVSGGEPLLHPQWAEIARLLRSQGLRLWLLSSGLALAKHAAEVGALFESVTVSLDSSCRASYAAIRGVDAFEVVCTGIRAAIQCGVPVGLRVTVQRSNFHELPQLVQLARDLGVASISFLAADTSNTQSFGRQQDETPADGVALRDTDLTGLAAALDALERDHAEDFRSGLIQESPAKLRRIHDHYRAVCGLGDFPPVRCNAPEFSAVVEADGSLRPCFFIAGAGAHVGLGLEEGLNTPGQQRLRTAIRAGRHAECTRCVCAKWRDLQVAGDAW